MSDYVIHFYELADKWEDPIYTICGSLYVPANSSRPKDDIYASWDPGGTTCVSCLAHPEYQLSLLENTEL